MAAHEPQVVDPVAACFDEDGALFVVEMRGYSERRDESLGRVKKLTDSPTRAGNAGQSIHGQSKDTYRR